MPKIGGLKLFDMISPTLKNVGFSIGRDRFMAILKKHNRLVVRKKKYYKTTDSNA
jgi:histidyl-tRNA synthetase